MANASFTAKLLEVSQQFMNNTENNNNNSQQSCDNSSNPVSKTEESTVLGKNKIHRTLFIIEVNDFTQLHHSYFQQSYYIYLNIARREHSFGYGRKLFFNRKQVR